VSTAGGGGRIPLVTPLTIYGQPGIQRHKKRDFLGSQLEYFFFFTSQLEEKIKQIDLKVQHFGGWFNYL